MPVGNEILFCGIALIGIGIYGTIASPVPYAGLYGIAIGSGAALYWWNAACEYKKKVQDAEAETLLQAAQRDTDQAKASNFPTSEVPADSETVAAIRWTEDGQERIIRQTAKPVNTGNLQLEINE